MREVCEEPSAQYTSNVERTVCATENTTESYSDVLNTFHNVMGKRHPYQSNIQRPRHEPTPSSVSSSVYNTSYLSRTVKAIC
jgi:hypothetical protein